MRCQPIVNAILVNLQPHDQAIDNISSSFWHFGKKNKNSELDFSHVLWVVYKKVLDHTLVNPVHSQVNKLGWKLYPSGISYPSRLITVDPTFAIPASFMSRLNTTVLGSPGPPMATGICKQSVMT